MGHGWTTPAQIGPHDECKKLTSASETFPTGVEGSAIWARTTAGSVLWANALNCATHRPLARRAGLVAAIAGNGATPGTPRHVVARTPDQLVASQAVCDAQAIAHACSSAKRHEAAAAIRLLAILAELCVRPLAVLAWLNDAVSARNRDQLTSSVAGRVVGRVAGLPRVQHEIAASRNVTGRIAELAAIGRGTGGRIAGLAGTDHVIAADVRLPVAHVGGPHGAGEPRVVGSRSREVRPVTDTSGCPCGSVEVQDRTSDHDPYAGRAPAPKGYGGAHRRKRSGRPAHTVEVLERRPVG